MTLRYPFQKLCAVPVIGDNRQILLAASGPTINCISFEDGTLIQQWPTDHEEVGDEVAEENGDRPNKRRKVNYKERHSPSRQQSELSDASIEIVAERKKGERKKSKFIDTKLPNVSHLLTTSDGKYVVAVTAEDKTINVFELSHEGKLTLFSQRSLPKKLCALQLSKDERTILAADKFGDVYAVPLQQSQEWVPKDRKQSEAIFEPSATELTVHTKRNRIALKQQLEQKQRNSKKEGLGFEHQLLLGHVSLLTDLTVAEGIVNGRPRPFILTADRDEHIRVSRGMPQAHIIESFCLGHEEFVTKLCIPSARPDLLIAGNGEPSLRTYDWQTGKPMEIIPIRPGKSISSNAMNHASGEQKSDLLEGRTHDRLAVSGIWPVNYSTISNIVEDEETLVLVAIEGLPLLLVYVLRSNRLSDFGSIKLRGNVLDVTVLVKSQKVLVSIDTVHRPFSMKSYREIDDLQPCPFQLLEIRTDKKQIGLAEGIVWDVFDPPFDCMEIVRSLPEAPEHLQDDEPQGKSYEKLFSPLGEFLYGLENLRKKRYVNADDEDGTEDEEVENLKLEQPTEG